MIRLSILALVLCTPWLAAALPLEGEVPQAVFAAPNSSPKPNTTHTTDGSSPERKAEMAALLDRYAPMFKLAATERYYPSSVQYMLNRYKYVQYHDGTIFRPDRRTFTTEHLNELPNLGLHQFLSLEEPHNGQPEVEAGGEFLYGPAGQDGAMEMGPDGRGRVYDEVYGFWVDQGRGVVDLWYWTFYPYNLGKEVGSLGWLGNHVTDWEHLRLRTIDGKAVSGDFNTHSGGAFSAGTYRWEEMERTEDDRPVAYVASGSHGIWPVAGRHVYAQLLNLWALVDMADDKGALWDTRGHVVPIEFWTGPDEARKIIHDGDQSWLEFIGQWGNREPEDCWWHFFVGICQLIDGPGGPNRDFGIPPDCIIGETSTDESTYSFYLTRTVAEEAAARGVTRVVVEQVCARPHGNGARFNSANASSTFKESDLEIWSMMGPDEEFHPDPAHQYHATAPACGGSRSAAKAYRLALRNADGERVSTSPLRTLCIYKPGEDGWDDAHAGHINDLDEWRWDLDVPEPGLVPKQKQRRLW